VPPGWRGDGPSQPDPATRARERYRGFALSRRGDAARGQALFANTQRLACAGCHTIDGHGGKAGPDLFAVGDKFSRREIIDAVITPSANIAVGYSTTILTTRSGDVIDGIVKDATDTAVTLMSADGTLTRVPTADIQDRRTSNVSMMPEGLETGLTQQEFTDLVEYLVSLKLPETAAIVRQGMPATIAESAKQVALVPFFEERHRFEHPDWFGQVPEMSGAFLVCEHETGRIWLMEKSADGEHKTLFGDFSSEIRRGGATGLLGLAFHPKFRENHKYYIQHERTGDDGRLYAHVSEKIAAPDFRTDSGRPSRTILRIACATDVHAGGGIEFGPDGCLYVAMGDTGPQGDPQGHGQDLKRPLGKVLRIEVDHSEGGKPYAIPADNPFRANPDALPEIWAYGFREPWRFSFDPANGDLWIGDVGQDTYEEVDLVRRGENYGWNVYEGFEPFSGRYRKASAQYVPPVFAYTRRNGNSVTGGYVYRADPRSPFYGVYVCADYTSKRIWALTQANRVLKTIRQIATAPERVASFGRDGAGALYVVGYEGMIYKMNFDGATFDQTPAR
jgi:putative heme-binding domain-containing protein